MLLLLNDKEREASDLAAELVGIETVGMNSDGSLPLSVVRLEEEERRRGSILPSHFGPVACNWFVFV